jgi:hypothetical protein
MSEFTIRSESVDVEQIMKQIRARILEKRGADYTEDQIRELASVRLEKFLEPRNLRSDLLEQFRKSRPAVNTEPPTIEAPYAFDDQTLFTSHRAPLRFMRKLLMPLLKLFFNPNVLNQILHTQSQFNVDLLKRESRRKIEFDRSRAEWNALYYEVLHNLVLETTRMGIESQNLRMRVESLSSRLDFSERRVRALEGVVQYRPEVIQGPVRRDREDDEPAAAPAMGGSLEGFVPTGPQGQAQPSQGDGSRKRRRRRRGRRGGTGLPGEPGASGAAGTSGAAGALGATADAAGASEAEGDYDGPDDADGSDDGEFDEPETQAVAAQAPVAPAAPEATASAPETSSQLRRDLDDLSAEASAKAEAASGRELGPDATAAPGSSTDGEQ